MAARRYKRLLLVLVLGLTLMIQGMASAAPVDMPNPAWKVPAAPRLSAGAAILMDWRTGQVLYARGADEKRYPASTTKILTAMIAAERGKLTDRVTISRRAANTVGSAMHIREGEVYSLHDLLHGLLLRSGNDAAVAIAEHIGGSVEAFADLMNEQARSVGATHSHFVNPHGLTNPDHYTTARDLALITRHALQNNIVAAIVSLQQRPLTYEYLNRAVVLYNTNRLLGMVDGADGVKTGTTSAAGRCLIASATRDEQKLVAVVLNAGNRWRDSAELLEWGFQNFRLLYAGREGETLLHMPVRAGRDAAVPLALGSDLALVTPKQGWPMPTLEVELKERAAAPIPQGVQLGRAKLLQEGKVVADSPLYAARAVPKRSLLENIYRSLRPFLRQMGDAHLFG